MRHRLLVLVLAAAAGLTLPGCEAGEARVVAADPSSGPAPLPVEVAWPVTTDIEAVFASTAALEADHEALIPARVAGQVVEIMVEEGDVVRAGQALARLDGERARLEMLQAEAELERAEREFERASRLRERGLVSAAAFEFAQFDRDALAATFELKRLAFEHTTVRATIPGVISQRLVKVGWRVGAQAPLFRIADDGRLVAELHVPQSEIGRIRAGQPVTIAVDALPGASFGARIARISPTVDARDGSFRATVYVDNPDGRLAPGMFGRFGIVCEVHERALVVPSRALVREDDQEVLYVVREGAALRRPVETGIARSDVTEIVDGLEAGEAVVVTGQGSLRDGSAVIASKASRSES